MLLGNLQPQTSQERKRHINLRNPRDTGRVSPALSAGQTGVCRTVSRGFAVIFCRESGIFAGKSLGHPPAVHEDLQKIYVMFFFFFMCLFSATAEGQQQQLKTTSDVTSSSLGVVAFLSREVEKRLEM